MPRPWFCFEGRLQETEETQAARAATLIESEGELGEIEVEMRAANGAVMGPSDPVIKPSRELKKSWQADISIGALRRPIKVIAERDETGPRLQRRA